MRKRKPIPDKIRLKVLKRDNFKCQICGKSPATDPEITLEVDHIQPHSKGGTDDLENLQTLCIFCNRGKGNDEALNATIKEKIHNLLDKINPAILKQIDTADTATIVANDTDFQELARLNDLCNCFKINVMLDSIDGYQCMYSKGIYTVKDNYGKKINFIITAP